MQALIQAAHGRCDGIGGQIRALAQQLGQSLIAEAVTPHLAVAAVVIAQPLEAVITVGSLLGKALEITS